MSNEAIILGEVEAEKVVKQISLSWSGAAQNPWHQVMRVVCLARGRGEDLNY